MKMDIEIRKLKKELLNDWLNFFDNGSSHAGCYCMHYHWKQELEDEFKSKGEVDGRAYAIKFINESIIQGYLAYYENDVIGWCNTNDKQTYDTVLSKIYWEESEKVKKIKSIFCFNIVPEMRGKGVATHILQKICSDAFDDGYEYIEAYPFINGKNNNYHGSVSMYEKNGFNIHCEYNDCVIVRKYL